MSGTIWFDLTASFHWHRAPSGITRVEQECLRWALHQNLPQVAWCVYDVDMACWYPMPRAEAQAVLARRYDAAGNAVAGTVSSWQPTVSPLRFRPGDRYLCLNADHTPARLAALHRARREVGLRIYGVVYDLIQVLFPHFYWDQADQSCARYLVDLAWCADHLVCISERTRQDLFDFYAQVGLPTPATSVVRLGDELSATEHAPDPAVVALAQQPFILTVGTIEIRKNHEVLYRALLDLLDRKQADLPTLVFAGMRGWRVDDLWMSLTLDPRVRDRIVILPHASDADIDHLYRHCQFSVFPSQYEGWGLPVAESLAYGKPCLASSAGAIGEIAPASLLPLLPPQDVRAWADAMLHWARHDEERQRLTQRIRQEYRVTRWADTAAEIMAPALAELAPA